MRQSVTKNIFCLWRTIRRNLLRPAPCWFTCKMHSIGFNAVLRNLRFIIIYLLFYVSKFVWLEVIFLSQVILNFTFFKVFESLKFSLLFFVYFCLFCSLLLVCLFYSVYLCLHDVEGMNEDGSFIGLYGKQKKQGETSSGGFATLV